MALQTKLEEPRTATLKLSTIYTYHHWYGFLDSKVQFNIIAFQESSDKVDNLSVAKKQLIIFQTFIAIFPSNKVEEEINWNGFYSNSNWTV